MRAASACSLATSARRERRARRGRIISALAAAAATAALLSACSSSPAAVKLPPRPSPTSASPSPTTSASAQAQVTAAWDAFWVAGTAAERTRSTQGADAILAATTSQSYITTVVSGMQEDWNKGEITYGEPIEHVLKVSIVTVGSGQEAFVTDCQDASQTGLESASTGQHIAGTAGGAHDELYGTLALVSGQWQVGNVTFVGTACSP
jgi:hypothetical protein